jgi:hypothetical protein
MTLGLRINHLLVGGQTLIAAKLFLGILVRQYPTFELLLGNRKFFIEFIE